MTYWKKTELDSIGLAEELDLSSLRRDGSYRKPVTMWVVRVGDDLYVRSVKGRTGPWFRGTQTCQRGSIRSGGVSKEVSFVDEADEGIQTQIDAAYRAKYKHYPKEYVDACVTPIARESTLKLIPRD